MPEQSYTQVMGSLAAKGAAAAQLSLVYLLSGSDDALKHEVLDRLQQLVLDPGFADFDKETIDLGPGSSTPDGDADPVPRILSAAGTAPFLSARRLVVAASIQRLSKERQSDLAAGIKQLGAASLLVLVADAPEWEAGRPKGRQLEASFKKAVAAFGVVVNCDAPQPADLKARAQALLSEWGKKADPAVIEALAEHAAAVTTNSGTGAVATLTRECEKLRSYVGERERITIADADALIPDVAQENIWRLLDAIGARNGRQAMQHVDAMLAASDRADGVVARTLPMLQRHFRMLMLGKFAAEKRLAGRPNVPDEVKDILTSELASTLAGQGYRMTSFMKQAANFSWDDLVWSSSRILASDLRMKGIEPPEPLGAAAPVASDDPASNLRLLVAQLCSGLK